MFLRILAASSYEDTLKLTLCPTVFQIIVVLMLITVNARLRAPVRVGNKKGHVQRIASQDAYATTDTS